MRGLSLSCILTCLLLAVFLPFLSEAAVVRLQRIKIFQTHDLPFWKPSVYFQCEGEPKHQLDGVVEANVDYNFTLHEPFQVGALQEFFRVGALQEFFQVGVLCRSSSRWVLCRSSSRWVLCRSSSMWVLCRISFQVGTLQEFFQVGPRCEPQRTMCLTASPCITWTSLLPHPAASLINLCLLPCLQPLTELTEGHCKQCGFYDADTLTEDDAFDKFNLCPLDFAPAPSGRLTRLVENELNVTFVCPHCNSDRTSRSSGGTYTSSSSC
ncbi:unnamed protein product [Closterium sp. Naga37s-1]|nr:unnamed protein product [Closterium sp. Naga37s-1]